MSKNEVAKVTTEQAVALPASVLARLAGQAKDVVAKERPKISKFGLKSGVLSYAGAPFPGNTVDVIILGAAFKNALYTKPYDPNNIANPDCFAFSVEKDGMRPHENVHDPMHPTCAGCPKLEWKSAPNGGKGKACKEQRRLVMIPANVLKADDPVEAIQKAELGIMDLSVMNAPRYSAFASNLASSTGVPPFAAVTNIKVVPDAKSQFAVNFTAVELLPSEEVLLAIEKRLEEATRIALTPYDESAGSDDAPPTDGAAAKPMAKTKF